MDFIDKKISAAGEPAQLEVLLRAAGYSEQDIFLVQNSTELERAMAFIQFRRAQSNNSEIDTRNYDYRNACNGLPKFGLKPDTSMKISTELALSEKYKLRSTLIECGFSVTDINRCLDECNFTDIDQCISFINASQNDVPPPPAAHAYDENHDQVEYLFPGSEAVDVQSTLSAMGYSAKHIQEALKNGECNDVMRAVAYIDRLLRNESEHITIPPVLSRFNHSNCRELLMMGYDPNEIAEALSQSDTISDALVLINGEGTNCPICLSQCHLKNMYMIDCPSRHRLCFVCISSHIVNTLTNSESQQMHITACPCQTADNRRCDYLFTQKEIDEVISFCSSALPNEEYFMNSGIAATISRNASTVFLDKAKREMGCIRCPRCPDGPDGSGFWFVPPDREYMTKQLVCCPQSNTQFCSVCNVNPYHYNCECNEVTGLSQNYLQWVAQGRREYAAERALRDESYRAQLEEFDRDKTKHDAEVNAANARINELRDTEAWKVAKCKQCPGCRRTINKVK